MPKAVEAIPDTLRPYAFHGLDLEWKGHGANAIGDCPFCGRESKFSVLIETGQWRCLVCAEGTDRGGGNAYIFLRLLWEQSDKHTSNYDDLATDRGVEAESLMQWGICRSVLTNEWLVPGYSVERKLVQLYRYVRTPERMNLLATPTLGHGIHGYNGTFNDVCDRILLCEGVWDAIAVWEAMGQTKIGYQGEYEATASQASSLLASTSVLAIPGLGAVGDPLERWCPIFAGKQVDLMFDSDHPRPHPKTGELSTPAGYAAMRRATKILSGSEQPPRQINYMDWGPQGYDPSVKPGYDWRDLLNAT